MTPTTTFPFNQTPTGAANAFGGRPRPRRTPLGCAAAVLGEAAPFFAIFLGLPLGRPLPTATAGGGACGLFSLGGRPLGLGGEITVPGGIGALGLGGRPRPRLGGAFGSGFM